jgi:hypothetical protein
MIRTVERLLLACLAVAVFRLPDQARAQFTDPHNYDNTPVGTNEVELAYTYARSNVSIDTGLIIAGARLRLDAGSIGYSRYFGLANHLMWVNGTVPVADLSGSVTGANVSGSISGAADSSYQVAALLKGGPALRVADFGSYKPETIVGVSLSVAVPSGQYNGNRILNLGSDRWLLRPEIAFSHPFGPEKEWQLDTYANCEFYTDVVSYRGSNLLSQQPLPGLEGHISYSFNDRLWAALDTRYSLRGDTSINGVDQNDSQQNFILGSEVNVALNSQHSLVFQFAKAVVHRNGTAYTGFTVKYDFVWGKGYKTKR